MSHRRHCWGRRAGNQAGPACTGKQSLVCRGGYHSATYPAPQPPGFPMRTLSSGGLWELSYSPKSNCFFCSAFQKLSGAMRVTSQEHMKPSLWPHVWSFSTHLVCPVPSLRKTSEGHHCKIRTALLDQYDTSLPKHFPVISQASKWASNEHCDFLSPMRKLAISGSASSTRGTLSSCLDIEARSVWFCGLNHPVPPFPTLQGCATITLTVGFWVDTG